jgi:hypothetical protein
MRYHYIPIRITKIKNSNNTRCVKDMEKLDHSHFAHENRKYYSWSEKQLGSFIKNQTVQWMKLLPNPEITHLGICSREIKTNTQLKNLHPNIYSRSTHKSQKPETTQMFFMRGILNKLWYSYTMEFYLPVKRNNMLIHTTT